VNRFLLALTVSLLCSSTAAVYAGHHRHHGGDCCYGQPVCGYSPCSQTSCCQLTRCQPACCQPSPRSCGGDTNQRAKPVPPAALPDPLPTLNPLPTK
jgi:hypothetical protein